MDDFYTGLLRSLQQQSIEHLAGKNSDGLIKME